MGNLSMTVIRVFWCEQAGETKETIAQQVASEWWCPAGVSAIEVPGEFGKGFYSGISKRYLFYAQNHLRHDPVFLRAAGSIGADWLQAY